MARRGMVRCKYYTSVLFARTRIAGRERGGKIKRQTCNAPRRERFSKGTRERETYSNRYFYLVAIGEELESRVCHI